MVSEDLKLVTFHKMTEMLNGQVNSEKFSIIGAVSGLSWFEFPRKVGNWAPLSVDVLLKNGSNSDV